MKNITNQKNIIDKTVYSAIQPTGGLTLGNYLGALVNMRALTESNRCIYSIADLHSLTVDNVPAELRQNSFNLACMMLACGLDNNGGAVFVQSHVPQHSQLAWVLNCHAQFGEARRMTQFKDKSKKNAKNINVGLFAYPVLMAADILLYNTDAVPIGDDQKQHLELARVVAERFNHKFSPTFTVPQGFFPKIAARIMSLSNPLAKMSKSDENPASYILMTDDKDTIMSKFKRAVTDSGSEIIFDKKNKPGISNLIAIYATVTNRSVKEVEKECAGLSYADFKPLVGEAVDTRLAPVRAEYNRLKADKEYVLVKLAEGANTAQGIAYKTLGKVYRKIGLMEKN